MKILTAFSQVIWTVTDDRGNSYMRFENGDWAELEMQFPVENDLDRKTENELEIAFEEFKNLSGKR